MFLKRGILQLCYGLGIMALIIYLIHSKSCADIYLYGSADYEHYTAVKMYYALLICEVSCM